MWFVPAVSRIILFIRLGKRSNCSQEMVFYLQWPIVWIPCFSLRLKKIEGKKIMYITDYLKITMKFQKLIIWWADEDLVFSGRDSEKNQWVQLSQIQACLAQQLDKCFFGAFSFVRIFSSKYICFSPLPHSPAQWLSSTAFFVFLYFASWDSRGEIESKRQKQPLLPF